MTYNKTKTFAFLGADKKNTDAVLKKSPKKLRQL